QVVWVPGSMEVPLALDRMLESCDAAACLGIIEKGETQHGLAMGQAVIKTILELQLKHNKPIGLGIIGPGAEQHHIEPRLEPHARAAVLALL
ncbi:MAG: 6,7-dimethyl-8-ribityllumazine synthase, partial [Candidatus Poseidonia sp.]|nr:6,7-dimethyl-8-ribityllumazine synthase [Poseidonia sp.]